MRASDSSVSAGLTSCFRQTQQLHKNEIGLDDIVFQSCTLDEHYEHEKYQSSGSCNRSCSVFDALHFLFWASALQTCLVTIIAVVPDELFQSRQVDRQTFVVDLFSVGRNQVCEETFTICEPDVSPRRGSRLLPLTSIELSSHVNGGNSSSQSLFNSIGQCVRA